MTEQEIKIKYRHYPSVDELPADEKLLCQEAEKALETSHSPYSKFRVGTAVKLKSGRIIYGSNQENVAYPSGLCAERVALFMAGSSYPGDDIVAMAITAHTDLFELKTPVTSCGACLQVMAEYEKKQGTPFSILFYSLGKDVIKAEGVKSLLPFMFYENGLEKR
ncbi:cytidine deaminase [Pedobacter sp. HMF7647]|uniref:Cytidine deaminase n=1 Tax=Hufsiella arboris TaxID=2695275 RepID=A0A7K1YE44_9SPHI|nr:cytidine deaminase [Hufsiella arboris]MXV52876.1 cytidine deaminase [Hufsiella arboris]